MVGAAVNVTNVPAQIGLAEAPIETLTGNDGLTVIDKAEEVLSPQTLVALTVTFPVTEIGEKSTVIVLRFVADVGVTPNPASKVQT